MFTWNIVNIAENGQFCIFANYAIYRSTKCAYIAQYADEI